MQVQSLIYLGSLFAALKDLSSNVDRDLLLGGTKLNVV